MIPHRRERGPAGRRVLIATAAAAAIAVAAGATLRGSQAQGGAALPKTGAALRETGAALPEIGAALPEIGAALPETGAALPETGAAPVARRIALTIDDLPIAPPNRHTLEQQRQITAGLLATLAAHDAPAIGFVNENKLEADGEVDPHRVALLERWLDAGHELGNHGYAHLDLHRVTPEVWTADVLRGERVTRPLVERRGGELRYFRHPFLHTGMSVAVQEETRAFLADHGYRVAPVTIDNSEWIYADVYANAWNAGDSALTRRVGQDYVRYMLDVVSFYEGQSEAIVGELIPQTLLIHAYALNADWLGALMDSLEARGYEWIDIDEALRHPAYARATHGYTGQGGITWLHRWAITEELDRSIFRGEPELPAWIEQLRSRLGGP